MGNLVVAVSGVAAVVGAALLGRRAGFLIVAITLVFSGVSLMACSNIAVACWISDMMNAVYVDVGAAISACGCVAAAYSVYGMKEV